MSTDLITTQQETGREMDSDTGNDAERSTGGARLTVLAGPTAVGKGTVAADIRERFPDIWISVSATTRKARSNSSSDTNR